MFTADNTTISDDPSKQAVERGVCFLFGCWIGVIIDHEVGVDVAITGMSKAGDGNARVLL